MRVIKMHRQQSCDLCACDRADYDAPTSTGVWAYMCEACYKQHSNSTIGCKLDYNIAKPKKTKKYQLAKRIAEDECECPNCKSTRTVEPDADYFFNCEGCGTRLKVRDCLIDTDWVLEA